MMPISRAMVTLARLTLLEARRTAVGKSALAAIVIALCLALFVGRIVLIEQTRATIAAYAAFVRVAIVLILGQAIVANTVRDLNERIIDHFLALPLTRMQYALGKWLGWSTVAVVCALAAALPLLGFTGAPGRLAWVLSFAAGSGSIRVQPRVRCSSVSMRAMSNSPATCCRGWTGLPTRRGLPAVPCTSVRIFCKR